MRSLFGQAAPPAPELTALLADRRLLVDRVLRLELAEGGVTVVPAYTPTELLLRLQRHPVDVVVTTPPPSARATSVLLQEIRLVRCLPVVLVVDSVSEGATRAVGRDHDIDVVGQSCSSHELVSVIQQAASRAGAADRRQRSFPPLQVGPLRLDQDGRLVHVGDRTLNLTLPQYRLARCLVERVGRVLSTADLAHLVWGGDGPSEQAALKEILRQFRRLLGDEADLLRNVHGRGYLLDLPAGARADDLAPCAQHAAGESIRAGVLTVDLGSGHAHVDGQALALPGREHRLLLALATARGAPVPVAELLSTIWPGVQVDSSAVRSTVALLRRHFARVPRRPRPAVATLRGGRYALGVEDGSPVLTHSTAPSQADQLS